MTSFIVYSHSSYSDCWDAFFGRNKRYFNIPFDNYYIFTDAVNNRIDNRFQTVLYDEKFDYTNRLFHCLNQISDDYVFFTHEDMILYDHVHRQYMEECLDVIKDVDFIKMLKGGGQKDLSSNIRYKQSNILKVADSNFDFVFSIQPSLWNRKSFLNLIGNNLNQSIWDFEILGQSFCRQNDFQSLYTYVDGVDKQRGSAHYDSITYPYIATAIYKGKWTTNQYPKELNDLAMEFNIDLNVRGRV